jgi:hypothetical protein
MRQMRSIKALELLRKNRINELKAKLEDEVYQESLKKNPNAKRRYAAMKKYFSYHNPGREILSKPCPIEFQGKKYTSFTNSWSLALTTEPTGEIELCSEPERYPGIGRIINFDGEERKIDFADVFARAKSKGYTLNKSTVTSSQYLMHYDGAYFRLGLLDATFRVIDNGTKSTVYHVKNSIRPLTIQNDIGICVIMPIKPDAVNPDDGRIIIDISEEVEIIDTKEIEELINRRRRQILVHSIIYYNMNENIVSDHQWSTWANELDKLQRKHPDLAKNCWMAEEFEDFDPSTGYSLPLDNPWAENKARYLLELHRSKKSA